MPVQGWFSTPIYYDKVQEPVLSKIQQEFAGVVSEFEKKGAFEHNENWVPRTHKLSDKNFNTNFLYDYKLDNFINELSLHIGAFTREIGVPPNRTPSFKIVNSWMTKFGTDEFAHSHDHGSSDISGTYYYKVPIQSDSDSGNIQFQSPVEQIKISYVSEHMARHVTYPAETGGMILFPSWLRHGVSVNKSDEDRISVSFNITFKRDF
jgi:uncharacterized protein (TIGR02466 family)